MKGGWAEQNSQRFFNTVSLYNSSSKVSIFGNIGGGVLLRPHGVRLTGVLSEMREGKEPSLSAGSPQRAILNEAQRGSVATGAPREPF